ncbi:MAG: zinc ribbon domain-containing protein [Candidatus Hodarchaeota archaeon]
MSYRNYNRKSLSIIALLLLGVFIFSLLISLLFFDVLLVLSIIIPIIIIIIIALVIIRFSWEPQKHCPRCNIPISIYSEYCRNCGLKLITMCPNCNQYLRVGITFCDNCGHKFEYFEESKEPIEYKVIKKGSPAPEKPNFCPTCGGNLKDAENLRFCEYCGSKLT